MEQEKRRLAEEVIKNGKNKIRRKNKRKSTIRRKMKGGTVPPCDKENYLYFKFLNFYIVLYIPLFTNNVLNEKTIYKMCAILYFLQYIFIRCVIYIFVIMYRLFYVL